MKSHENQRPTHEINAFLGASRMLATSQMQERPVRQNHVQDLAAKVGKGGQFSPVLNCLQAFNLGTRSQIHVVQCLNSELRISFGSGGYL